VRQGRFLEVPAGHRLRLTEAGGQVEGALARGVAVRHDQRTGSPAQLLGELHGAAAPRRRYSDGEVRDIVKRATEIEATAPTAGGTMTIGGVEALAAEVGIKPDIVRAAADAVVPARRHAPSEAPAHNPWIGGPTTLVFERTVEGELPEAEFPAVVDEIRRLMRKVGLVSQLGRSFSWVASRPVDSGRRDLEISVAVRNGRTRITVQESLSSLVGGIFGGIGGGMGGGGMGPIMGITVGALNAPVALIAIVPAWLAITYATARFSYRATVRRRAAELERAADRLADAVQELVPRRE
jgi:hypothetical protein